MNKKKLILLLKTLIITIDTTLTTQNIFTKTSTPQTKTTTPQPTKPKILITQHNLNISTIITTNSINYQI